MKVAVLERFADPSRRCDAEAMGGPEDELAVWNLTGGWNGWRSFVADLRICWRSRSQSVIAVRLLIACLGTGGAQHGALARAVELLRRVRAGQIESIACFSAKDFALAELLAKETGAPCRELLSRQTQYFGEFGFELFAVVPYAYWLHRQGRLERTIGGLDTRCLYYFSENHEERPVKRHYVPITEYPVGERGWPPLRPDDLPKRLSTHESGSPHRTGRPFGTSASAGRERSAFCPTRSLTSNSPTSPRGLLRTSSGQSYSCG